MKRNIPIKFKEQNLINKLNDNINDNSDSNVTVGLDLADGNDKTTVNTFYRDPKTGRFCSKSHTDLSDVQNKRIKQRIDKELTKKLNEFMSKPANASPNHTEPANEKENYEFVNHPPHYNSSSIETIEKMRRIWGNEKTALWCEMTAFKYRDRIGNKPDNSNEQEVAKIKWYENKAKQLRDLI